MWNARQVQDDDDSWEVRAFAEDTGNSMGTTWPPRSYTCTFCRREFRSAQALGGHMNVHRRDRARLRQSPPVPMADPSSSPPSSSTLLIPTQELVANGGYCLLYPLLSPSNGFTSTSVNGCMESPSTLLSISPYQKTNFVSSSPSFINFPVATSIQTSMCHSGKIEPSLSVDDDGDDAHNNSSSNNNNNNCSKDLVMEELDLELRLGRRPSP